MKKNMGCCYSLLRSTIVYEDTNKGDQRGNRHVAGRDSLWAVMIPFCMSERRPTSAVLRCIARDVSVALRFSLRRAQPVMSHFCRSLMASMFELRQVDHLWQGSLQASFLGWDDLTRSFGLQLQLNWLPVKPHFWLKVLEQLSWRKRPKTVTTSLKTASERQLNSTRMSG